MAQPQDILEFWFGSDPKLWFSKNDAFDAEIRDRFAQAVEDARAGRLTHWERDLTGLQALVILLDQFARNLYRGSGDAFAYDHEALRLSHLLTEHPRWDSLTDDEKRFAVMPMMHAEDLQEQKNCVDWMRRIGGEDSVRYAILHMEIIERFGRFPHRNAVLGRQTSEEEQAFLDDGGFAG